MWIEQLIAGSHDDSNIFLYQLKLINFSDRFDLSWDWCKKSHYKTSFCLFQIDYKKYEQRVTTYLDGKQKHTPVGPHLYKGKVFNRFLRIYSTFNWVCYSIKNQHPKIS